MTSVKRFLFSVLGAAGIMTLTMSASWRTDFEKAKDEAKKEHKLVLLKFSGSDWCVPCIRMEKEIFNSEAFSAFASEDLVMVNADFPRKKGSLNQAVIKQNEALAEQYDKEGHFPYTVLLDADGKVLKTWDGYKGNQPDVFIDQIKAYAANR